MPYECVGTAQRTFGLYFTLRIRNVCVHTHWGLVAMMDTKHARLRRCARRIGAQGVMHNVYGTHLGLPSEAKVLGGHNPLERRLVLQRRRQRQRRSVFAMV